MIDIYSKLIDDRIIFLATEMESDICNIIKTGSVVCEEVNAKKVFLTKMIKPSDQQPF